jgi:ApbE superfamily uncharacterized protein (UPF0280 family)
MAVAAYVPTVSNRIQARLLPGHRLHLHDGPIDLIIGAWGEPAEIESAHRAAEGRMSGLLDALCQDLPVLRGTAIGEAACPTGRRMQNAVAPYAGEVFLTPMATVAGAVAEEVLGAMTQAARLSRAFVNNGGDMALHLAPGERLVLGAVDRPDRPALFGTATISAADPVRGVATSGWRGRSFSLGLADAVTVLAPSAAAADAAATVIANAVDLPNHPGICRVPAHDLDPMSDLGARLVTRDVPKLSVPDIDQALARGVATARRLLARGHIVAAALHMQGTTELVETGRIMAV